MINFEFPETRSSAVNQVLPLPDWLNEALVVAMPAAAVGGFTAGIYTAAENGVRPWRQALLRWITSRSVRGNGAVLVRQEGAEGGAVITAMVDPGADYLFEALVHLPGRGGFGEAQDKNLQIWMSVLDPEDHLIAEAPAQLIPGDWSLSGVSFSSGPVREVRCLVRAKSPQQLPCFYFIEGCRLIRKDQTWWNPQNLFNASRTVVRLQDDRELLVRTLDPDVVAGHNGVYLNWDGFFTQHGIAVGGGQWEQEYNHLSVDDPMVEQFRDDGIAREIDGKEIEGGLLWPGYHMCHNAPGWHAYYKRRFTRIAPEVQLLSQDNICAPSFMHHGKGCFCRWCREGFRDWLSRNWDKQEFVKAGIHDQEVPDIVDYISKIPGIVEKGGDSILADPVLREYIHYQNVTQMNRWRETVAEAKQSAGQELAVCGNQSGADGYWPYSVALSQAGDLTFTEPGGGAYSPLKRARDVLATKIGLAAGEYRRPVWICLSSLFQAPEAAKSRLRMSGAQTLADGGVPLVWSTTPGASGWFYDTEAKLCRFVQEHRALFIRRDRCANIGLVYSIPTRIWREFDAFNISSRAFQELFLVFTQILEELHLSYEVNCWCHPELGDDTVSLERLERYQVLILPGVDCFSNAQRDAVHKFQARGGKVISVPRPRLYNTDALPRAKGESLVSPGPRLFEIEPEILDRYRRFNQNPSQVNSTEAKRTESALKNYFSRILAEDLFIETNAPSGIWANLWLDSTRKILALHLVNGHILMDEDQFHPLEGSRWKIRIPDGLEVTKAILISPDKPEKPEPIPVKVSQGWATVVVPEIESYTIVALFSGDAMEQAEKKARERRTQIQSMVRNLPLV